MLEIHNLVENKVAQLRTEANQILENCKSKLIEQFGLPNEPINKLAFSTKFSNLISGNKFSKEFRLEADFYHPKVEKIIEHLNTFECEYLGDLAIEIHSSGLRERNFVKNGIPLFAGQHLGYSDLTQISCFQEN